MCRPSNNIAGTGGEALATLVVRGSPLRVVNLEGNRIGDDGAKAWGIALRKSTTLDVYVAAVVGVGVV